MLSFPLLVGSHFLFIVEMNEVVTKSALRVLVSTRRRALQRWILAEAKHKEGLREWGQGKDIPICCIAWDKYDAVILLEYLIAEI